MRCVWDDEESGPVCGACTDHFECGRYGFGAEFIPEFGVELCIDERCTPILEVIGTLPDGAACGISENCKSGWCSSGICVTPTPGEIYCIDPSEDW
jgi:hypothetical protein